MLTLLSCLLLETVQAVARLEEEYAAIIRAMREALGAARHGGTRGRHAGGARCGAADPPRRHRAHLRASGGAWRVVTDAATRERMLGWDFASESAALAALATM